MLRRGLCWLLCAAAAAMSWLLCAAAFYRYVSMQTLRLQNWRCPQADACKWSTLRIPGDSLCLSAHTGACARRGRMNLACRLLEVGILASPLVPAAPRYLLHRRYR